jgi:hypothetical protein
VFHVELEVIVGEVTTEILLSSKDERALMEAAMDYFFEKYLIPEKAQVFQAGAFASKANLFNWSDYKVARNWIMGHKALAATLRIRTSFKPWELMRVL